MKAITKHKLFFIEDVVAYLPCSKPTFYEHKLNESIDIKTALENNKIEIKVSMRNKWFKSDNATLQMGLYKLLGSQEEYHRLSNTRIDITTREEAPFKGIDLSDIEEED